MTKAELYQKACMLPDMKWIPAMMGKKLLQVS